MIPLLLLSMAVFGVTLLLIGGWGYTTGHDSEACCAGCRYPTVGLTSETCPECGGDLRGSGTRAAGSRVVVRPSRWVAMVCRTVLLGCFVLLVLLRSAEFGDVIVSRGTAEAQSAGGGFRSLSISGRGAARDLRNRQIFGQRVARTTTARLVGPRRTVTLRMLDASGRVRYDGPEGVVTPPDGFSVEHVLSWMRAAGVDTSEERAVAEAEAVHALVWHVVAEGGDTPSRAVEGLSAVKVTSDRYNRVSRVWLAVILVPTAVVWGLLLWDVARWESRGRRKCA